MEHLADNLSCLPVAVRQTDCLVLRDAESYDGSDSVNSSIGSIPFSGKVQGSLVCSAATRPTRRRD